MHVAQVVVDPVVDLVLHPGRRRLREPGVLVGVVAELEDVVVLVGEGHLEVMDRRRPRELEAGRSRCRGRGSRAAGAAGDGPSRPGLCRAPRSRTASRRPRPGRRRSCPCSLPWRPSDLGVAPAELSVLDRVDVFGDLLHLLDEVRHAVAVFDPVGVGEVGRVDALGDPVHAEVDRAGGRLRRLGDRVGVAVGIGVVGGPGGGRAEDPVVRRRSRPRGPGRAGRRAPAIRRSACVSRPRRPIYRLARRFSAASGRRYFSREPPRGAVRVALAQTEPHRRRHRRQRRQDRGLDRRRPRRGRRAGDLPRALPARLPGRGPLPEAPFRRGRTARAVEELAAGVERHRRARRLRRAGARETATAGVPTTRSPCSRTARSRAVYRKIRLPNYAVFDEQRYFIPGAEPATVEVAGTRVGLTICEDCWVEGPPASIEAAAGRRADRESLGLAVPPRQGARARGDVRPARPRLRRPTSPSATSSAARTSWSSTATASCSTRTASRSPARPSSRRSCSSARCPPAAPAASPSRCPTWPRSTAPSSSACATTSRKNGFGHVGLALSGRHRLRPRGAARRRRARRRARHLRRHALAPFQP